MKRLAVLAAFALLAACQPAPTAADDVPSAQVIARIRNAELYKFCDQGRAIYGLDWNGSALAVVENAPECA